MLWSPVDSRWVPMVFGAFKWVCPEMGPQNCDFVREGSWGILFSYNVRPTSDVSWFISPRNTIVISTINHSYWSYKPTERYLGGLTLYKPKYFGMYTVSSEAFDTCWRWQSLAIRGFKLCSSSVCPVFSVYIWDILEWYVLMIPNDWDVSAGVFNPWSFMGPLESRRLRFRHTLWLWHSHGIDGPVYLS